MAEGRDWRPKIFAPSDAREAVKSDGTGMCTALGGAARAVIGVVGAQRKRARAGVLESGGTGSMRNLFRKEPPYITVPGQARPASGPKQAGGDGLWVRCENERCRELLYVREFENNLKVCHKCEHHARLTARERIAQLVDENSFVEYDADLAPADPLEFVAAGEAYPRKLREAASKTGELEAAVSGTADVDGVPIQLLVLD